MKKFNNLYNSTGDVLVCHFLILFYFKIFYYLHISAVCLKF